MNAFAAAALVVANGRPMADDTAVSLTVGVDPARVVTLGLDGVTVGLPISQARALAHCLHRRLSGVLTTLVRGSVVGHLTVTAGVPMRAGPAGVALDTLDTEHPAAIVVPPGVAADVSWAIRACADTLDMPDWRDAIG